MPSLDDPDLPYLIALTMVPQLGPVRSGILLNNLGSAEAVFRQRGEILRSLKGIGPRLEASIRSERLLEKAGREIEFLRRHRIRVYRYGEKGYPKRLEELPDKPLLLFCKGESGLHSRRILSVVGTRKATSYGRQLCRELVEGLAGMVSGLSVVSGLAYGIDIMAHRAALDSGIPTVAVLGHGFRTLYPAAHSRTARQIADHGSLVTDFHSETGPERNNFLRRNRIIAGLADATLVVESAAAGGALITAGLANGYGRVVLAVPGRKTDLRSEGCNKLIRNGGAGLAASPDDVLFHLNWEEGSSHMPPSVQEAKLTAREKQLIALLRDSPKSDPGTLSRHSGIPAGEAAALLLGLELKGWIRSGPGNLYSVQHMAS